MRNTFFGRQRAIRRLLSRLLVVLTAGGVGMAPVQAEIGGLPDGLSLRGFGTLGLARSSSDHTEFVRDLSQPKGLRNGEWSGRIDSVLGVQANWMLGSQLELVGQLVSRLHYDGSRDPELMRALAKWDPDPRLSLRAGRIGADFMMLADSRLVGYSYLPVRPNADFFGPLFFSHFDGLDVSLSLPQGENGTGVVRGKLFAGRTQEKAAGIPGVWDTSGSPVKGLVVDYLTGPWQYRLNLAEIRFSHEINSYGMAADLRTAGAVAAADSLSTRGKSAHFLSLGIVYDQGPLQVQGMVNRIRQDSTVFEDSHAGYVLAGYRLGAITPYAGLSRWITRGGPYSTGLPSTTPTLAMLNANYAAYMAASRARQTTYSLGARWDVQTNIALKLQWDAICGDASSRFPFASSDAGWNGRTDVISTTMDFIF